MDPILLSLLIFILLAFAGWGYGIYYPDPNLAAPAPLVHVLGAIALMLLLSCVAACWQLCFAISPLL
jgi:hypothetical protein